MDAFGNVLEKGTSTGYSAEHQSDPQPYHLTTREYDPDIGLYYFSARWYDPTFGRFISHEPLLNGILGMSPLPTFGYQREVPRYFQHAQRDPRLWNRYAFCAGNALSHADLDARFSRKST